MAQRVLYVDPAQGNDSQAGHLSRQPLKTITAALRRSQTKTTIYLKAGLYSLSNGEQFPLTIPSDCQVVGAVEGDRAAAKLEGGGAVQHPVLGSQTVTCRLQARAALKNVSLSNPQNQGIGVWMESGLAHLQNVWVMNCQRYGGIVLGNALPTIADSLFENCDIAGIAFFSQGKGQLERVICRTNGTGILLQNSAAPLIRACQVIQNRKGLVIVDTANPVLRDTRVTRNQTYGLQLTGRATADFGQSQAPGNNVVRNNGQADIHNSSQRSLIACGNDLLPQYLEGKVELIASEIPDTSAVPSVLLGQPANPPTTDPPNQPTPDLDEFVPGGSARFSDMANHWAGPFVDGLIQAKAVAGFEDGTFRPDQWVTRAQFAAFVLASFPDRPEKFPQIRFQDIPPGFWAQEALSQVQRMGFLSGYPDGTIRPNEPITRIQALVALTNGLGLTGGRVDEIGLYRDRAQVPSYAVDALATATQRRLVVNYPEPLFLRPLEPITRGEVSTLIYQGRVTLGLANTIRSPYIVQPDMTQPRFSDLTGHWAANFIQGLAAANLVSGMSDGSFAPDAAMTRAQFAALVVNALQPRLKRQGIVFYDVPSTFWASEAIQTAYRGEFVTGFPDQTFAPNHPLLRVQIWVALVSGLDWENPGVDLNPLGRFADYTNVPRYALRAVAIAAEKSLIVNYPDRQRLRPNQIATRAEVCAAVYQALVARQNLPAIASIYLV